MFRIAKQLHPLPNSKLLLSKHLLKSNTTSSLIVSPAAKRMSTWLISTAAAVFGMVVLGGVTRLTRSGLSMVDWKPQQNFPPITKDEWEKEFDKYKQFPEYKLLNKSMTLEEFKKIYYMEWAHRTYGRGLGLLYGIPMLMFLATGTAYKVGGRNLQTRLLSLFLLGGSQGLVGWWMVKSGLEESLIVTPEPRVSPYRLTAHLTMAVGLYSGLLWTGWTLLRPNRLSTWKLALPSKIALMLIGTTMFSGAFVAGNDAGRAFNDWPLYAGEYIPEGIWKPALGWKNFLENTATVQFDHRMLAYATLITSSTLWYLAEKSANTIPRNALIAFRTVGIVAWFQASLGIVTLMTVVPVSLGSAHQAGALTLWTCILYGRHALRYVR